MLPPTVHLSTGACILHGEAELDVVLDGAFALSWQRRYASHHAHCGLLGPGWTVPVSFALERGAEKLFFIDLSGRRTQFPLLDVGERFYSRFEHTTLVRTGLERYELITSDGVRLLFAPIIGAANTATLPVHSVQDANGNGWHLHYGGQSFPQVLEGSDGYRIGFIYDERFTPPASGGSPASGRRRLRGGGPQEKIGGMGKNQNTKIRGTTTLHLPIFEEAAKGKHLFFLAIS